jgi:hypothetical protein
VLTAGDDQVVVELGVYAIVVLGVVYAEELPQSPHVLALALSPLGNTAERAGASKENKTTDLEEVMLSECRTNVSM